MNSDSDRAVGSWRKAEAHLKEAMAQDAEKSPMAMIHASYYAMFHAARAVLFQATGSAPKRHDQTIQRFGMLVKDVDDALRAAGKAFNAVKDQRSHSDYDEHIVASPQEATEALRAALDFLDLCGTRYAFRQPLP